MVKAKIRSQEVDKKQTEPCMVFQNVTHNSPELCFDCVMLLKGFNGTDAAEIDQSLFRVIRKIKKHQRTAAVQRLVTRLYPGQRKLRLSPKARSSTDRSPFESLYARLICHTMTNKDLLWESAFKIYMKRLN